MQVAKDAYARATIAFVFGAIMLCWLITALSSCSAAPLDSWNKPKQELKCAATNPWLCPDGHSCCKSYAPVCMGPDSEGYYCQPSQDDPEDQVLYGSKHRERAAKRVDE